MTTWNSSAKQKITQMHSIALDFWEGDDNYLKHQFDRIARAIREGNATEEIHYGTYDLGQEAVRCLVAINQWNPEEMLQLLVSKQHDYGHGNILAFGIVGVGIRACDKVARYFNLKDQPDSAHNEPFIDCLKDMVGYAIIGMMLHDNTFILELENK
jgi:hypothetical protein